MAETFAMSAAFVSVDSTQKSKSRLFGMSEWRDLVLDEPATEENLAKPLGVLPTRSKDVLLQGQSRYLQLVDEHQIELFQRAIDNHGGVLGTGLLMFGDNGDVLPTMPLVEIQSYMTTDYGVFCKVRAVGRAAVLQRQKRSPESVVTEKYDQNDEEVIPDYGYDSNYDLANDMADQIKNHLIALTKIEEADDESSESNLNEKKEDTRWERYQSAYRNALDADQQGYVVASGEASTRRSWKELAAVSWAAFSTSSCPDKDATFRLNAMNSVSVTERLDLAMYWLSDLRSELENATSEASQ